MVFSPIKNDLSGIIQAAEKWLATAGIDNPKLDTRILIAHALQLDRSQLLSQLDRVLTQREKRHVAVLVECRARREPVARILHRREFWSLPFGLNEATLVPRPESETLIEAALKGIQHSASGIQKNEPRMPNAECRILDLGTGSGCLLLALLHELPKATGVGIDIATRAVDQAKQNAKHLKLAARADFRVNNWADGINEQFDLIISNPPYIIHKDIAQLMPEVRDYDPTLALDGGEDGLAIYRQLIPQLSKLLKSQGMAVFEIGEGQGEAVCTLFQAAGFNNITTYKDLAKIERCIAASMPNGK